VDIFIEICPKIGRKLAEKKEKISQSTLIPVLY
jgi:hypothetical protein